MAEETRWITAREAVTRLRVRPQTLYAYVSRGRVQARPSEDDPRRSLYSEPDVDRLALSSRAVRRPSAVAASAITWGEPMLSSAISTVHAGRLIYRGHDAVELSQTATLEETAALLWQAACDPFPQLDLAPARDEPDPTTRAFIILAHLAASAETLLGRSPENLAAEAAQLLKALAVAIGRAPMIEGEPVHGYLARCWSSPQAADPLRRALVLLADHELNVSTFAARVTASSGASLPACVLSGLCALTGPRHGRAGLAVGALVRAMSASDGIPTVETASELPGFGHPLYAGTDVRAATLLATFEAPGDHIRTRDIIGATFGLAPNIDFALSAMTARFGLPEAAPFLIFAIARSVGWIAHALEQVSQGGLIRPRARYDGSLGRVGPTSNMPLPLRASL